MYAARSTHISQCATGLVIVRQARNRSITFAARNGCEFELAQGIAGEKGVAKSRDTARRSARATGVGLGFVSLFFASGSEGSTRSGAVAIWMPPFGLGGSGGSGSAFCFLGSAALFCSSRRVR